MTEPTPNRRRPRARARTAHEIKPPAYVERPNDQQAVPLLSGKSSGYTLAAAEIDPAARHAAIAKGVNAALFEGSTRGTFSDFVDVTADVLDAAAAADISALNRMLAAQAMTLDQTFTMLLTRSMNNMGKYPDAVERYARLAFKAQAQSRATIEALAKIVQPREQTVRHIHVGPDGQAVFIENYNGGIGNGRFDERAHAPTDAGGAGERTTLLGHDTLGSAVPFGPSEGESTLSDARRGSGERGATR